MANPLISIKNITKTYKEKKNRIQALDHLTLDIYKGEFLVIMGPSGSGKSTLLDILACIDTPDEGSVWYRDLELTKASSKIIALYRQRIIGIVFQRNFNLIRNLSVNTNLLLPRLLNKVHERQADFDSLNLLLDLNLKEIEKRPAETLSLGEQQRVAIARVLMNNPEIIIADEPTGNLDSANGARLMEILKKLNEENGKTIIIVTHNPEFATLASRVIYLKDGKIERTEVRIDKSTNEDDTSENILKTEKAKPFRLSTAIWLASQLFMKNKYRFIITLSSIILALAILVVQIDLVNLSPETISASKDATGYNNEIIGSQQIVIAAQGKEYFDNPWLLNPYLPISPGRLVTKGGIANISSIPHVKDAYPVIPLEVKTPNISFFAETGSPVATSNLPSTYFVSGAYFKTDTQHAIILNEEIARVIAGGSDVTSLIGTTIPIQVSIREIPLSQNVSIHENATIVGIQNYAEPWIVAQVPYAFGDLIQNNILKGYPITKIDVDGASHLSQVKDALGNMGYAAFSQTDELHILDIIINLIAIVLLSIILLNFIAICINILNAIVILVVKKSRMLMALLSIGVRKNDIKKYILLQGIIIGTIAGIGGWVLGYVFSDILANDITVTILGGSKTGAGNPLLFVSSPGEMVILILISIVLAILEVTYYMYKIPSKKSVLKILRRE